MTYGILGGDIKPPTPSSHCLSAQRVLVNFGTPARIRVYKQDNIPVFVVVNQSKISVSSPRTAGLSTCSKCTPKVPWSSLHARFCTPRLQPQLQCSSDECPSTSPREHCCCHAVSAWQLRPLAGPPGSRIVKVLMSVGMLFVRGSLFGLRDCFCFLATQAQRRSESQAQKKISFTETVLCTKTSTAASEQGVRGAQQGC
jgi:hypothetical protein